MNKYTFLVTRLTYSEPVVLTAASEDEAYDKMEVMLLNDQVDFNKDEDSDFNFEIDKVEPVYTTMQASQQPVSVNGYTPMSSVRIQEEENEDVEDQDDSDGDSTYTPMFAIKPKQEEHPSLLESSLLLLQTIERLSEELLQVTDKAVELESINRQLSLLARKN
jgi:hypothetical protein